MATSGRLPKARKRHWPGTHDASSIERQLQADVSEHVTERRPALYLAAFAQDLETMPPEVVLGRVARFLRNDLRAVLAIPDWRNLSWHVDRRCLGCDYLGYRWSTDEDAAAGINTPPARSNRDEHCAVHFASCAEGFNA